MKFTYRAIFLLLLTNFYFSLFAQENKEGKIEKIQDYRIEKLVEKHIAINEYRKKINGYRVQIHFGSQRDPAKEIKTKFLQLYPDMPAYELYQQPNFKIRIGDFRTKVEAYKFLKDLQKDFPNAFIVQDEINLPVIP